MKYKNYNIEEPFHEILDAFKNIKSIDLFKACSYYPDILQYQNLLHPLLRIQNEVSIIGTLLYRSDCKEFDLTRAKLFFNMVENNDDEISKELLYDSRCYLICLAIFHNVQNIRCYEVKDKVFYAEIPNMPKIAFRAFISNLVRIFKTITYPGL